MNEGEQLHEIKQAAAYVCDKFGMYDLEHNEHDRAELERDVDRLRRACWPELSKSPEQES
ncbi:MAG TPA: hypothetical protein VNH41_12275 [Steroidobacteraceae bacterium]|nr:hypothetical protein [Steroidobacteraceae bacterium]